ncbi:MAG TPA: hypothetical protein VFC01_08840 [Mycobacterium sp.]|nr:hypothetical protein [Mycobacterium sp.]
MADAALRTLLWLLGQCIARGSRYMPSLRSQITRTMTFELSAGERVARHWVFDAQLRRATTYSGHASAPDCAVHINSSWQALRALVSPVTVDKIVRGLHEGTVELHGSAFVLLWFHGLTRKFVKLGRPDGPRHRIPGTYIAHDPAACGAETIVIEPAVVRLDPTWTGAWKARSTLSTVRACTDEPMLEP